MDQWNALNAPSFPRVTHGGARSNRKRKTPRPFSPKAPIHLVMRSSRAKGSWSLSHRKNLSRVTSMIYHYANRFHVRVDQASVRGSEIHLLVKAWDKKQLSDFLRVLAGRVAITISGALKGQKKIGRFWDFLCWSKILSWGAAFHRVRQFLRTEALQSVPLSGVEFEWICELTPE